MTTFRSTQFELLLAILLVGGACSSNQHEPADQAVNTPTANGPYSNSEIHASGDGIDQLATHSTYADEIAPKLETITLSLGDLSLKRIGDAVTWQRTINANGIQVVVDKTKVTGMQIADRKVLWTSESVDGCQLGWVTANGNVGLLVAYHVNDQGQFDRYSDACRMRRIDLQTGKWQADLQIEPGKDKKVNSLLAAVASEGDLAVLVSLNSIDGPVEDDAPIVAYQLTCFRGDKSAPRWSKAFKADKERGYGGVYVWGITPPKYAGSDNQKLTWLDETLIVAAEDLQPIMALNRDTGTQLWQVEKIWEFDRGFIGPSVYNHYIGRFGVEEHDEGGLAGVDAKRKVFDQQFTCAVIGGPAVVPLNFERGSDSHSIFVAVSKSTADDWPDYLSDCVIYELNEKGTPISMVKVPQLVDGGQFKVLKDGLVWAGQNESFLKLVPSQGFQGLGMGPGGPDLISRLAWFHQTNWTPPQAWLTSDRAADPVAFNQADVFFLPGGGYIVDRDDHEYKFPITMLDLATGLERDLVLNVPFEGTIPVPDTNYSGSEEGFHKMGSYILAVTDLSAADESLDVTIGMENWSRTFKFSLEGITRTALSSGAQSKSAPNYDAKIAQFKTTEALSVELQDQARSHDVEYLKALLSSGADPKYKSNVGWTALMSAACYGTAETVKLLIAAGSDVNAQDANCGGQSVLMWAARSDQESKRKVKMLLAAGADKSLKSEGGWNALLSAASSGNIDTVELLLAGGFDIAFTADDGTNVLIAVAHQRTPGLISVLVQAGADINAQDKNGMTPLMHAAEGSDQGENLQVMLNAGADPSLKDNKGLTALDHTTGLNHSGAEERAKLLKSAMKQ